MGGDPCLGSRDLKSELPLGQGEMVQSRDTQGQGPFGRAAEGRHVAWDGGVQVLVSGEWDLRLRCLSSAQGLKAGTQGPSEPITG